MAKRKRNATLAVLGGGNPKRGKKKHNPTLAVLGNPAKSLEQARAAYREFHGVDAPDPVKLKGGPGGVLVSLGELARIDYVPSRGHRRKTVWFHHFKAGVFLAATPDGKCLYIIDRSGKARRVVDWSRGIVR